MATIEVAHLVVVKTDDRTYGLGSRPVCSCGWSGYWYPDYLTAATAGVEHRDGQAGPPSPFDALCSDLLGVMDDLAAAVSWLAETWPDDLPTPGWSATGVDYDKTRPALRVLAYCDAGELDRAAAVMGVAIVDDPAPNSSGDRYRRAGRRFGRVLVEAYSSLPFDGEVAG